MCCSNGVQVGHTDDHQPRFDFACDFSKILRLMECSILSSSSGFLPQHLHSTKQRQLLYHIQWCFPRDMETQALTSTSPLPGHGKLPDEQRLQMLLVLAQTQSLVPLHETHCQSLDRLAMTSTCNQQRQRTSKWHFAFIRFFLPCLASTIFLAVFTCKQD